MPFKDSKSIAARESARLRKLRYRASELGKRTAAVYNETRRAPSRWTEEKRAKQAAYRTARKNTIKISRPAPLKCESCEQEGRICLDHDHITGLFRGWLCFRCNAALGLLGDTKRNVSDLLDYMARTELQKG